MAVSDSLINTLFDGRYKIIRKLGAGGMANVYLAEDQELGRRVAIKILNERHANDEQFVDRFRREAKHAAGLSHPNIVAIYDRGEAEGTYYIAMEYLDGRSLKELIVARGPAPVNVAIDYARKILDALRFAHRNGIVHRDIKPHNVIVDAEGRVKVTDFGIARAGTSQMTEVGSIIGTAQYLSPEQAKGAPVDQTSDLYSVGIVLYELLTGKVPFTGDSPVEIAMKHISAVPEPPSSLRPDIPRRPRPDRPTRARQNPRGALPERGGDGQGPRASRPGPRRQPRDRGGRDDDPLALAVDARHDGRRAPAAPGRGLVRVRAAPARPARVALAPGAPARARGSAHRLVRLPAGPGPTRGRRHGRRAVPHRPARDAGGRPGARRRARAERDPGGERGRRSRVRVRADADVRREGRSRRHGRDQGLDRTTADRSPGRDRPKPRRGGRGARARDLEAKIVEVFSEKDPGPSPARARPRGRW